jgi:pyrimidine-nucleoside phosphorylase
MSKKIAAGADAILLDVKTGTGAFMKTIEESRALARAMVDIGKNCGRKTAAIITDMSAPLGNTIGNSLELLEVIQLLSGKPVPKNLLEVCEELSANMLFLAEKGSLDECRKQIQEAISSGRALQKLADMVEAQGGDRSYIENPMKFYKMQSKCIEKIISPQSGYIVVKNTEDIGIAAMILGAGRTRPEDAIDHSAGIVLSFAPNDYIEKGQVLAHFYTAEKNLATRATEQFLQALAFSPEPQELPPLIHEHIS